MSTFHQTNPLFSLATHKGFITSSVVVLTFILAIVFYSASKKIPRSSGGFDYTVIENEPWAGPQIGQKLDFSKLRDQYGIAFSNNNLRGWAMFGLINTGCGMCILAKDHLEYVRENCKKAGVSYFVTTHGVKPFVLFDLKIATK